MESYKESRKCGVITSNLRLHGGERTSENELFNCKDGQNSYTANCTYNIEYVKLQIMKNIGKAKIGVGFLK